jgi:RNA recognition motif-containing protein
MIRLEEPRFGGVLFSYLRITTSTLQGSELKKLFIGNLPANTTENDLHDLFSEYGTVRSSRLISDVFSGLCKGFGFVEMEGHEARAAIAGLNGKYLNGNPIKVNFESPKKSRRRR